MYVRCKKFISNPHNLFAVAVYKLDGIVVGHVPRKISSICSSLLSHLTLLSAVALFPSGSFSLELFSTWETISSTSLLAALMEDDGTISEKGPIGRGSVDRLIG